MRTHRMLLFLGVLAWLAVPAGGATVTLTPSASTASKGVSYNFSVSVSPATYVRHITVTYQGENGGDVGSSSPFNTSHTFSTPANGLVVTATVSYTNGDPDEQATATVDVVGLTITGSASPLRAWPTSYTVQSNPSGKTLSQINWTYHWGGGSNTYPNSTIWSGKMVANGTITVSAVVSGVTVQATKEVEVTPRGWPISITCAQDNDPNYGDIPTYRADLGCNRDRDSNVVPYIFVPRDGETNFSPARTLSQVTTGPCAGLWYVASSTLKCQRETVINRYIKLDGEMLGDNSFATANAYCLTTSVGDFVQAVKNHEYRGTPDTFKSEWGHQGRIEQWIIDQAHDPKQTIEGLVAPDQYSLSDAVNTAIVEDENEVSVYALDEVYMRTWGPNWGGGSGLGTGQHSCWDDGEKMWTGCENTPDSF